MGDQLDFKFNFLPSLREGRERLKLVVVVVVNSKKTASAAAASICIPSNPYSKCSILPIPPLNQWHLALQK